MICSFVTRSSAGAAASIPAIHVHEASHPSAACWCVESGKEARDRGEEHIIQVSGEYHNDGVAYAATGLGETPDKEKKRGGEKGEKSGAGCTPKNQGEKKRGRRGGKRGEGKQDGKTGCISPPLPAGAPAMPPCHAVA